MDGHWAAIEAAFVEEKRVSTNRDLGDCDAALAAGDVVQASYRAPYLVHAPLEPVNATVLVGDGRVDVWTGTQIPRFVQNNVAKIAGVEPDQVHVHVLMMGGSFGHRLEDDVVRQAAEIAVAHRGRPIKLTYTREEDVTHDYPRPLAMARAQGQISDGGIKTVDLQISSPSVMGSQLGRQGFPAAGPDAQIVAGAWEQPFAIENYRVRGYKPDLATPISSWRSVGASQNAFFHESFFDELCHAAGVDPVAERLRLCDHDDSRLVIQAAAEMANWGADLGLNRAQGIAFCMSFGVPVAEVVQISQTDQGIKLDAVFVAADVGKVLDPVNFENLVQGGVLWGLGHAIMGETTYTDGAMEQNNFDSFESLRLYQTPQISVRGLELGTRVRGIGEPPVPPAAPALANAIFALTGQRLREMPFQKFVDFA
jgi:isoquinoline 1-oxidoreductase beta subunit